MPPAPSVRRHENVILRITQEQLSLGILLTVIVIRKDTNQLLDTHMNNIERFHLCHTVLQHGRRMAQTDLDIQGSHTHHTSM